VSADEIAALADADARENWGFMIAFRDRLLGASSLEAAYLSLARGEGDAVPPLFMNQLAQVVLRNALDGESDPFVLRAAELFYRPQKLTHHEGTVLLADAEVIEQHEQNRHASPLLAMLGGPAVTALDVLDEGNAEGYFARSDAFDTVLNLGGDGRGRRALAEAMRRWVRHLLGVYVAIEPVERMEDQDWAWFVGLDAEATRIGNTLWNGRELEPEEAGQVAALFRLAFDDPGEAIPAIGSRPVWLILAAAADRTVRMKPQNLVASLPLRAAAS
jgi:hypothetical protein